MRLAEGDAARPFAVKDVMGNPISLQDFAGRKLLLSFYRYVACPLCNLRIHELGLRRDYFAERGLDILAFFQSPAERILKKMERRDVPFPIVGDPQRAVYALYGVESSWAGVAVAFVHPKSVEALVKGFMPGRLEGDKALLPADFLIGPDLKIHTAFYSDNITEHMPMDSIETFLS
jgi:peroxiredoxin